MKFKASILIKLIFCLIGVNAFSQTDSTTFLYTGSTQTFIVPCVTSITVKAWGGGGSGGGNDSKSGATGGGGAFIESDIPVTPGQGLGLWR